ncbi:MAG: 3-hydroxybutyryl-CoA dehydratase [Rubrivivax sp. SCN 71-131]|jgi:enoyl-CoA hydratase/carnithine racemase|nr:MAG: 3-hydroxybutyryl-CoA dehydratase [Rubrivivax sp. SCN 71-131]
MPSPTLAVDGAVATITLQRPDQANRLEPEDLAALVAHVDAVDADPALRVLLLRAQGRHFCSGFDIGRVGAAGVEAFERMVDRVEAARPVTLAVVQGGVFGGATDLALACDFRLGASAAELRMPAARLGLHFYRGGLERFVSRLGVDVAKRLFLAAERLDAEEMKAIGYLTHLVRAEELQARAAALAAAVAAGAPLAVLGMKQHLNRIARGRLDADALAADVARTLASADLQEGRAAFADKRTPRFTGA